MIMRMDENVVLDKDEEFVKSKLVIFIYQKKPLS